jgi:hypothetical protein
VIQVGPAAKTARGPANVRAAWESCGSNRVVSPRTVSIGRNQAPGASPATTHHLPGGDVRGAAGSRGSPCGPWPASGCCGYSGWRRGWPEKRDTLLYTKALGLPHATFTNSGLDIGLTVALEPDEGRPRRALASSGAVPVGVDVARLDLDAGHDHGGAAGVGFDLQAVHAGGHDRQTARPASAHAEPAPRHHAVDTTSLR